MAIPLSSRKPSGAPAAGHGLKSVLLAMLILPACTWLILASITPSGTSAHTETILAWPVAEAGSAAHLEQSFLARVPLSDPSPLEGSASAVLTVSEAIIHGSILGPGLVPIVGTGLARVELVDACGLRRSAAVQLDGSYAMNAPSFGRHWVRASADGFLTVDSTVELRADAPILRQDFILRPAVKVRVRVITPDGQPLLLALQQSDAPRGTSILVPVVTRLQPGPSPGELSDPGLDLDAVGHFVSRGLCVESLAADCLGILILDCEMPVWVSLLHHQAVLQTLRVDPQQDEVTFIVSPGTLQANLATIRLQAVDAVTGMPIPSARVRLRGGMYPDLGVATDQQGLAVLANCEPGRFDLELRAHGYERLHQTLDAMPGGLVDLGTVTLSPEVCIEGTVVDATGQPLAATFDIGILDPEARSLRWLPHQRLKSGGDGAFRLEGLGRGEYVLRTDNHDAPYDDAWQGVRWVSGNRLLDTRSGSQTGVEIRLRPASVMVLRVAEAGDQQLRFRVLDELGLALLDGTFHAAAPRPLGLPAGSYRVLLLDARGSTISEHHVTLDSTSSQVDLTR